MQHLKSYVRVEGLGFRVGMSPLKLTVRNTNSP